MSGFVRTGAGCLASVIGGFVLFVVAIVGFAVFAVSGTELTRVSVIPGSVSRVEVEAVDPVSFAIWLDLDLEWTGKPDLAGDIQVLIDDKEHHSYRFDFSRNGNFIEGQSSSLRRSWTMLRGPEDGSAQGDTWLFDIDNVAAGQKVTLIALLSAGDGMKVDQLDLVIEY